MSKESDNFMTLFFFERRVGGSYLPPPQNRPNPNFAPSRESRHGLLFTKLDLVPNFLLSDHDLLQLHAKRWIHMQVFEKGSKIRGKIGKFWMLLCIGIEQGSKTQKYTQATF